MVNSILRVPLNRVLLYSYSITALVAAWGAASTTAHCKPIGSPMCLSETDCVFCLIECNNYVTANLPFLSQ